MKTLMTMTIPRLLAVTMMAGCQRGSQLPSTFPVSGEVIYNGQPVEGASVILVTKDPGGKSAHALTDAAGRFTVATYFNPSHMPTGALPGDYAITVTKSEMLAAPADDPSSPGQPRSTLPKPSAVKSTKPQLPAKYASRDKSGLAVRVGPQTPPLKLDLRD